MLADASLNTQAILLGTALVVMSFVIRRSWTRGRQSRLRNPLKELQQELKAGENSPVRLIESMELRMHDYAREVEGRVETRLALLDELVQEADREIDRLEKALAAAQQTIADYRHEGIDGKRDQGPERAAA